MKSSRVSTERSAHREPDCKSDPCARTARASFSVAVCSLLLFVAGIVSNQICFAQTLDRARDLTDLSLEELLNLEVTSVAKHQQKMLRAPASIYVLTAEDIRRLGANSIPEALRVVPGLQVARINANEWAISARGFNGQFSDKLLVLIDGRSVYAPIFSGVYWDVQDVVLEDIDRIEVICGPGASLWGANAVNGVINIITKQARDTPGVLASGGYGSNDGGFGTLRYGFKLGGKASMRVYAKYFSNPAWSLASGGTANDEWQATRGGARLDWNIGPIDQLSVQGDIYHGSRAQKSFRSLPQPPFSEQTIGDFPIGGGDVLGSWTRTLSRDSQIRLQAYFDRATRAYGVLGIEWNTFDVDFQHSFSLGSRNAVVWGAGLRTTSDHLDDSFTVAFTPDSRFLKTFSGFVQDELRLSRNLRLTMGSKFEHNGYTGFEVQPSGRLIWDSPQHAVWGAVSRAVRTPSRAERDVRVNALVLPVPESPNVYVSLLAQNNLESEKVVTYEGGYRFRPNDRLLFRLSGFYNVYDSLASTALGTPFIETEPSPAHLVQPIYLTNTRAARSDGAEAAVDWAVTHRWKLAAGYSWFEVRFHRPTVTSSIQAIANDGDNPRHQFQIRSLLNLTKTLEVDPVVYYVSHLPVLGVPSYTRVDLRLGWRLGERWDLSIAGQNLLDESHVEFVGSTLGFGTIQSASKRGFIAKATWRF